MSNPRPASEADLIAIHALDRRCSPVFETVDGYARLLDRPAGLLLVQVVDRAIAGFAALSWVIDEATLLNLVVEPTSRGTGVGRHLLAAAWERLRLERVTRVVLELRASNTVARALYDAEGFQLDGRRRGYYPAPGRDEREDALLMSLDLGAVRAGT